VADERRPIAVLLLPRALEGFILRDQAADLLRADTVIAVEAPRLGYGLVGRLPPALADVLAAGQARRMELPGTLRVVVVFHPLQYPLAHALLAQNPEAELWYSRWDRYEFAYDASDRMRRRLEECHEQAASRSVLTFTVSERLAELEREAGREAIAISSAADAFPAPSPEATIVAMSLGHHGHRVDWALLDDVATAMPELVVLLVGDVHPNELSGDEGFAACQDRPNVLFLGRQDDEAAARLFACADVGIVPFKGEPFNDAGLPNRILKAARLGRRTIVPRLAGALTWSHAVTVADGTAEWVAALRAAKGTRCAPDTELRAWALEHTAESVNAPLWARLRELGVA
jgi:hypothetical protein